MSVKRFQFAGLAFKHDTVPPYVCHSRAPSKHDRRMHIRSPTNSGTESWGNFTHTVRNNSHLHHATDLVAEPSADHMSDGLRMMCHLRHFRHVGEARGEVPIDGHIPSLKITPECGRAAMTSRQSKHSWPTRTPIISPDYVYQRLPAKGHNRG